MNIFPFQYQKKLLADFRELGVSESKLQMFTLDGYDHSGGIIPTGVKAVSWFLEFTASGN